MCFGIRIWHLKCTRETPPKSEKLKLSKSNSQVEVFFEREKFKILGESFMQRVLLVAVFAFSLFLKVASVAGAEGELKGQLVAMKKTTTTTVEETEEGDENKNKQGQDQDQHSKIENNINVNATPAVQAPPPSNEVSSVLGAKAYSNDNSQRVSIIPLLGATAFNGNWYDHVKNSYTMGLALDLPATNNFSVEAEGYYAKSSVQYGYFSHDFNQYSMGLNGKYYLSRSTFQPYLGAGMSAIDYENMSYGPTAPGRSYSRWIGAAQGIAGMDVTLSQQVAVGIRGAYIVPVINRPSVANDGRYALPHYEEASLINNTHMKLMGTARFAF